MIGWSDAHDAGSSQPVLGHCPVSDRWLTPPGKSAQIKPWDLADALAELSTGRRRLPASSVKVVV
jgi:hypothetical protein